MNKYFAELVGTFVLVFGGVGSAVLAGQHIGNVGIALAFGLTLLIMYYAIGAVSGCHINPAVTFGMYLSRRIKGKDAIMYAISQIIGSIFAAAIILFIARGMPGGYNPTVSGLGSNGYGMHSPDHFSMGAGFVAELVLTMFLVFTILGSTDRNAPKGFAGVAMGLALTLDHLVALPITNTSVNPARSIGPALFAGGWAIHQLWLFIAAPLAGAALAAVIYAIIRERVTAPGTKKEAVPTLKIQTQEEA